MKLGDIEEFRIKKFYKFKEAPDEIFVLPTTRIGIEIEAEHIENRFFTSTGIDTAALGSFVAALAPHWEVEADGSLRNGGREFVSKALFGQDLKDAIEKIGVIFQHHGINPVYSERTSVHIHMDVGDITTHQLARLVLLYIMFEPVLFGFIGPSRKDNIYCTPLNKMIQGSSGLDHVRMLINAIRQGDRPAIKQALGGFRKYTALNLKPILSSAVHHDDENNKNHTGGHVEFRHSFGTHHPDYLIAWINILMSLKKAAIQNDIIDLDYNDLSKTTTDYYGPSVFGPHVWNTVLLNTVSPNELLQSIRLAERAGISSLNPNIARWLFKTTNKQLPGQINKKLNPHLINFYSYYSGKLYHSSSSVTKDLRKASTKIKTAGQFTQEFFVDNPDPQ